MAGNIINSQNIHVYNRTRDWIGVVVLKLSLTVRRIDAVKITSIHWSHRAQRTNSESLGTPQTMESCIVGDSLLSLIQYVQLPIGDFALICENFVKRFFSEIVIPPCYFRATALYDTICSVIGYISY